MLKGRALDIYSIVVPTQVENDARRISQSKSLRGTLFKPCRRHAHGKSALEGGGFLKRGHLKG